MGSTPLLDCTGRRRSPATLASFHLGLAPMNKGLRYPPDPPTVQEIVGVMCAAGGSPEGVRLRGIIVVLWRAGLRISEALALNETDLDPARGSLVVRHGKGDKRREVGMDRWAWTHLDPWRAAGKDMKMAAVLSRRAPFLLRAGFKRDSASLSPSSCRAARSPRPNAARPGALKRTPGRTGSPSLCCADRATCPGSRRTRRPP